MAESDQEGSKKKGKYRYVVHTVVLQRRQKEAELYCQGFGVSQIAKMVNVSPATISEDLKFVREHWLARMLVDFDERQAEELAKIDRLEQVAWKAWERSCNDFEEHHKRTEKALRRKAGDEDAQQNVNPGLGAVSNQPAANRVKKRKKGQAPRGNLELTPVKVIDEKRIRGQAGDERFLGRVAWCIETRLKLMGLLKDEKKVVVNNISWEGLFEPEKEGDQVDPLEAKIEEARKALPAPKPEGQS